MNVLSVNVCATATVKTTGSPHHPIAIVTAGMNLTRIMMTTMTIDQASKLKTRIALDQLGGHWSSPYRYTLPPGYSSLVGNLLHRISTDYKDQEPLQPLKCFVDRGVHIQFAQNIKQRAKQKERFEHVINSTVCWFDSTANVWHVKKIQ